MVFVLLTIFSFPSTAAADHVPLYQCAGIGVVETGGCDSAHTLAATRSVGSIRQNLHFIELGENPAVLEPLIRVQLEEVLQYPLNPGEGTLDAAQRFLGTTVPGQEAEAQAQKQGPTSCAGAWDTITSPGVCLVRATFAGIGSFFIYIGVKFVTIAAGLFETVLKYTVVNFGNTLSSIESGINAGWTALRDISNIVIIGMFVFIAISLILGIKEYGERKMIAKVLVIAVLINFSLLFTQIIIDASNFTARQFHQSMVQGVAADASVSTPIAGGEAGEAIEAAGIGSVFIGFLGIAGFADAYDVLRQAQENSQYATAALAYGFLSFVFLAAVAIVFLYGTFLLVSRAVLLIFLMLTSALAFASYLIPKFAGSNYGWHTWWNSLLRAAVLAPLLMIFLWMTARVSYAVVNAIPGGGTGALGRLATNASSEANLVALFSFILILGLLFASFRAASAFSHSIAGFSFAGTAAIAPFTLGSRFAGGLLRGTVGAGAYFTGKRLTKDAREARDKAAEARTMQTIALEKGHKASAGRFGALAGKYEDLSMRKMKYAGRAGSVADSRFNVMNTKGAQALAGAVGVTGFAAGASSKGAKSFAGQVKARAEAAEKLAAKIAPSSEQNETARKEAREQVRRQRELGLKQLEAMRNAEKTNAETAKTLQGLPQKLSGAQQNLEITRAAADQEKVRIASDTTLSTTQQKAQMAAEDSRIKQAEASVQVIQKGIDVIEKPWKDADKALKDHEKETEGLAKKAANDVVDAMRTSAIAISEKIGERQGDILTRAIGTVTRANKAVADETKDLYKKKVKTAGLRDVIADIQGDRGAGSSTTPPTPPAGP